VAPSAPPDARLEAIQRRLRHDWSPEFHALDRIASAEGIRVNAWNATASGEVRTVIVEAESADHLARLLGALNSPGAEPAVYWYAAQIGPGIGATQGRLKVRLVGAGVRREGS
jgi:ribosomal protein S12 methylthiotransferase accessory factor YcaO